jgi:Leucine-rich repeat (LRR) protein
MGRSPTRNTLRPSLVVTPDADRNNNPQNNDDDDHDDEKYAATNNSMMPLPLHDEYESDGGWSDDSGKDSDAYVESPRRGGRRPLPTIRLQQGDGDGDPVVEEQVFDATRGSKKKRSSVKSTNKRAKSKTGDRIASFFTTSRSRSDDDEPDEHDQLGARAEHESLYSLDSTSSPQQSSLPHVEILDPAARAALAAGYAAAAYDNQHSHESPMMDLEHNQQQSHFVTTSSKDGAPVLELPDNKTFRSTAWTEVEEEHRRRRYSTLTCLLIGVILTFVLVAALVGGILGATVLSKQPSKVSTGMAPSPFNTTASTVTLAPSAFPLTLSPTTASMTIQPTTTLAPHTPRPTTTAFNKYLQLYNLIVAASPMNSTGILDIGTPQNLAFVSIQANASTLSNARLLQRYALRVFYYSTNGPTHWINQSGWNTTDDECTWYSSSTVNSSMVCDSNKALQVLEFDANNLTGTLPDELSMLTGLTRLYITGSSTSPGLTGAIPNSLGQLTNMRMVALNNHQFNSSIPEAVLAGWGNSLRVMSIVGSELTGSIPTAVSNLTFCSNVLLDFNMLTGSLPLGISNLSALVAFSVSSNQLSGTLPPLDKSTALKSFSVSNNQLSGTLPSLQTLTALKSLSVANNSMTGPLPSFSSLVSLSRLYLSGNNFTGAVDNCGRRETVTDCTVNCTCCTSLCV